MAAAQGSGSAGLVPLLLLLLSVLAILCCSVHAVDHTINWNQVTDYSSWSATNNVQSGDTVTFNWVGSHTATVVSQADYQACSGSNALSSVQNGGSLTVGTGTSYVICTVPGHCTGGMRVQITPSSTPSTPSTPATPRTPTTPGTSPTTPMTPPATPTTPVTDNQGAASGLQAGTALVLASVALLL